jgi:hypothetical protein
MLSFLHQEFFNMILTTNTNRSAHSKIIAKTSFSLRFQYHAGGKWSQQYISQSWKFSNHIHPLHLWESDMHISQPRHGYAPRAIEVET